MPDRDSCHPKVVVTVSHLTISNFHWRTPLEVGVGLVLGLGLNTDTLDADNLASGAGDADVNLCGAEAAGVLEEVVVLAGGCLPGAAAVGADFEALDGLVVVDDLHREPVLGGAALVVKNDGRGDAAGDELVRSVDNAVGTANGLEGVGEEIEMTLVAFRALVDNLGSTLAPSLACMREEKSYHGGNGTAGASDLNARTALGGIVPDLAREGSSKNTAGQSVSREHAVSTRKVSAVKSGRASLGTAAEALVGTAGRRAGAGGRLGLGLGGGGLGLAGSYGADEGSPRGGHILIVRLANIELRSG